MASELDDAIRENLVAFAMKGFAQLHPGMQLIAHPYIKILASQLRRVADGEIKRLCVSLPPRHAKTFVASIAFSAWLLARNPAIRILLLAYGQELADKIAFDIRAILQSDWYCRIFKTRIAKNRSKLNDFVTTAGGGLRSISIEGGVTGLGADIIIVDDPLQIKDCENRKQLEHIQDVFDSEIRTRLNNPKDGAIVIIAHRLAADDLVGHVLQQGGWKLVKFPLIAPRSRTYAGDDGFVWRRKKGELLRPEAFTSRDIKRLRAMKRQPDFEILMQQNPSARDRLRIKAEYFGTFEPGSLSQEIPMVLSVDPGQTGGPTSSYGVIQAWSVHLDRFLLVDQVRERARYYDFRALVRQFVRRYRPSAVLIEATGQGPALISDIRMQDGMEIIAITPQEDKVTRLRKHQKTLRACRVALPNGAMWADEFIAELTTFPSSAFDDQVDALSQFLDWINDHPDLQPRPPRAFAAASLNGRPLNGRPLGPAARGSTVEMPGAVWHRPFGRRA